MLLRSRVERVFTFNGDAGSSTAIDPVSGEVVGTVPLGGKPEFGVTDGIGHLFVNIEDKGEVVEIDPVRLNGRCAGGRLPPARSRRAWRSTAGIICFSAAVTVG